MGGLRTLPDAPVSGADCEVLAAGKPGKNMAPFILHPSWEITKTYSHEGEEFLYVLEGMVEFLYGEDTYVLEKGDHVYFDACIPHTGKSLGDQRAALLAIKYFYKRNRP